MNILLLIIGILFFIVGGGIFVMNLFDMIYPGPLAPYYMPNGDALVLVAIGLALLIAGTISTVQKSRQRSRSFGSSRKRKTFPGLLLALGLLVPTLAVVYFAAVAPSEEAVLGWFCAMGEFICQYDMVLIGILLVVNLIELVDVIVFAKRDEVINANYEIQQGDLGLVSMFGHYFCGIFCRGPLFFSAEERNTSLIRIILCLVSGIVKFLFWLLCLTGVATMVFKPGVYDFALAEGIDYSFTLLILYLLINCNVFAYALYRILPLHEIRTYRVTAYYSDGSSRTHTTHKSNIVAILLMSALLYLYYSAYYVVPMSRKLNRVIETNRLQQLLSTNRYAQSMLDLYD